jgi:hypothetical protein
MAKFEKGRSGNPGGRPKESHDVKELAQQHGPEAIERLVEWMKSENPKASVSAAQALLDRGFGKAAQPLEHSGTALEDMLGRIAGRTGRKPPKRS